MAVAGGDDALAAGRAHFWTPRLELSSAMIERAKERGEVDRLLAGLVGTGAPHDGPHHPDSVS